jgi:hypothetical protein
LAEGGLRACNVREVAYSEGQRELLRGFQR